MAPGRMEPEYLNLCSPDGRKSCAACCGLYNIPDATRKAVAERLKRRTDLFQKTERTVAALDAYQAAVKRQETGGPLDDGIHVCEFTGFLDPSRKLVGCLLHPSCPDNLGIDLRGLCYYGSMACKTFFCPSWNQIPQRHRSILVDVLDDWHLYGLVMTDTIFVQSLFALLEGSLGEPLDRGRLFSNRSLAFFKRMLSWKTSWPFSGSSTLRRSRFYLQMPDPHVQRHEEENRRDLLESLQFTFGHKNSVSREADFVRQEVQRFVRAYRY